MPNITQIMPPRVPLVDARTGMISREWYRFFFNQFEKVGDSGESLEDLQLGPVASDNFAFEIIKNINQFAIQPAQDGVIDQIAEMQKQIQGLQLQPQLDIAAIFSAINTLSSAPVVKTADFTVADGETWLINNKVGSTCTVTLPAPASNVGRVSHFQNYQNEFLVSASANVIPIDGSAASTSILLAVAGQTATLVANGTNWVMTQSVPNNALLFSKEMTVTVKVLVPAKTVENAQTTQYTASGVTAIIDKFTATNYSASTAVISVNLVTAATSAGNDNLIVKTKALQPSETYTFPELVGHSLMPSGFISTLAGTASAVNIRVSGREIT